MSQRSEPTVVVSCGQRPASGPPSQPSSPCNVGGDRNEGRSAVAGAVTVAPATTPARERAAAAPPTREWEAPRPGSSDDGGVRRETVGCVPSIPPRGVLGLGWKVLRIVLRGGIHPVRSRYAAIPALRRRR